MPLSLSDIFGSSAQFNPNTRNLEIAIDDLQNSNPDFGVGDFTNGLGMNTHNVSVDNIELYAERIFWALIQLTKQNQPQNNTDPEINIYITSQGKRNITRGGVAQIGFAELITGYKNDSDGLTLDPDQVGA